MPTYNLSPIAKQQFFDSNGNLATGYLLYTYLAGTTTATNTYTTQSGSANANPIVLDARGEADIWLDPTITYKFVLKTAAGATVWTVDNITVGYLTLSSLTTTGDVTVGDDIVITGDTTVGGNVTVTGTISTSSGDIPQNSQNAGYTLVLTDKGKHIYMATAGAFTIPANASVAFPTGSAITFYNPTTACTIAITSDTLRWAATGGTGTRTLAQYGIATILKVASTVWSISGTGLS